MVIGMWALGEKIWLMGLGPLRIKTALFTQEVFAMICRTDMASRLGQTIRSSLVSSVGAKKVVQVHTRGQMARSTRASGA